MVSLPAIEAAMEGDGTKEVCATLSLVTVGTGGAATTEVNITVTLATQQGQFCRGTATSCITRRESGYACLRWI